MRNIIIDTDPGIDDILAILFALKCEDLNVEALTTVSGNVPVEIATRNALKILEIANRRNILVASGASRPLRKDQLTAELIHGKDGLANMNLSEPTIKKINLSAVELMKERLLKSKEPITIVAIGPMTNLAILNILYPRVFSQIEEIIFMGGAAFCPGNITSGAEFNIYVDPDAADLVFNSGVKLKMIGLDVTMKTILKKDKIENSNDSGDEAYKFFRRLINNALEIMPQSMEKGGIALHDPLAIGACLSNDILKYKEYDLKVETEGSEGLGVTLVDDRSWSESKKNAKVAVEVDNNDFIDLFLKTLRK